MATAGDYRLGRGYLSATRLNSQQYFWRDTLGYALHPSIPVASTTGLKIADIGTGTGLWLIHLLPNVPPGSELHGYDISADQFIPPSHLPSNIHLSVLDAKKDPPESLQGSFDIVHLRLLGIAVRDNDPRVIIEHSRKLLKPGGILQWDEFDHPALFVRAAPGEDPKAMSELMDYVKNNRPLTWFAELPNTLAQNGFDVTAVERRREHPWQRSMLMDNNGILFEELSAGLHARGETDLAAWMRNLIGPAMEDSRKGSYVSQVFQVVVARKL